MREIKRKYNNKSNSTSYKNGHAGLIGEFNPLWKGNNACYGSKHDWVKKWFGTPSECENCGTTNSCKYDWANLSGNYLRERNDWKRLCRKCHHKLDNISKKRWETRIKKYGRNCLVCSEITTSKHQLCPIHLKIYFDKRRSNANFSF